MLVFGTTFFETSVIIASNSAQSDWPAPTEFAEMDIPIDFLDIKHGLLNCDFFLKTARNNGDILRGNMFNKN